jgi:SH3 domain-containing YSC84-like protein 1
MKPDVRQMAQWAVLAVVALAGCGTIDRAHDPRSVSQTELQRSQLTLDEFRNDPQMAGFRERLKDAKGVIIAPRVGRGGFIFGGSGGEAVALVREPNGQWSAPAFYKIAAGSVGLQIGGDVSEIVMLLMTDKAVNGLLSAKFDLGADASVAAGPMGMGTQRDITADVLSFAKSRGAYAGVSVGGAYIQPDEAANEAYYGKRVTPVDILVRRNVQPPSSSASLQRSLRRLEG